MPKGSKRAQAAEKRANIWVTLRRTLEDTDGEALECRRCTASEGGDRSQPCEYERRRGKVERDESVRY